MVKTEIHMGNKDDSFPKMMIGFDGQVVLFTEHMVGVVVTEKGDDKLGEYSESWDMGSFSDFIGSVTITNEG